MPNSLQGKVVIVTGAGRGIGRSVALHAANEGALIIVNDREAALAEQVAAEIVDSGGQASACPGSVSDWDFAHEAVRSAIKRYGRLDGLVNNAALHYTCLPWDEHEASIRALVEVNVMGPIFCGHAAIAAFKHQGGGSIINVCSAAYLGADEHSSYGATKGAIASLTYGWAIDGAAHGIRANAIAPLARTRMTDAIPSFNGKDAAAVPQPEEIAPLFSYLLGDRSTHISGQIIRFNGSHLGVMEPPGLPRRNFIGDRWTLEQIEAALGALSADNLPSIGLGARLPAPASTQFDVK
jgi:NAD(P)-dependent dehydrogenase (short-subunit alcohol dehydrogenase family)